MSFVNLYPQVDYFGLELMGGSLYVHMNLGSGPIKIQAARSGSLSDTEWHQVEVIHNWHIFWGI